MSKKILIVVPYLSDGGAERVASLWANFFAEKKYDINMINFFPTEGEYYLDGSVKRFFLYDTKNKFKRKKILKNVHKMGEIINYIRPDIIIPFLSDSTVLVSLACKNKYKIINTIRNSPWHDPNNLFLRLVRNYFIKKESNVIFQTEEQRKYFKFNVNSLILPNFVKMPDANHIKKDYKTIHNIIAVGRLTKQKNFVMLLKSIKILVLKQVNIRLDIYGEGPQQDKLLKFIRKNKLNNYVRLMGRSQCIQNILKEYDLFIMSSKYEGFPNALIEAMSVGLPVISTSCKTGPKDIIDNGVNGFLMKNYSPNELVWLIESINDVDLLMKIGHEARDHVCQNYNENLVMDKLVEWIDLL